MRLIQNNEMSQISGGSAILCAAPSLFFMCAFASGMQGIGAGWTLTAHAGAGALVGMVAGVIVGDAAGKPALGTVLGVFVGTLAGTINMGIGYGLGSLYRKEDPVAA